MKRISFDRRLRQYCALRMITQQQLAEQLEMSKSTLNSWLNPAGNYLPSLKLIPILAKKMDVSESWLLGYPENGPEVFASEYSLLMGEWADHVISANQFSDDLLVHAREIVQCLEQCQDDLKAIQQAYENYKRSARIYKDAKSQIH